MKKLLCTAVSARTIPTFAKPQSPAFSTPTEHEGQDLGQDAVIWNRAWDME